MYILYKEGGVRIMESLTIRCSEVKRKNEVLSSLVVYILFSFLFFLLCLLGIADDNNTSNLYYI